MQDTLYPKVLRPDFDPNSDCMFRFLNGEINARLCIWMSRTLGIFPDSEKLATRILSYATFILEMGILFHFKLFNMFLDVWKHGGFTTDAIHAIMQIVALSLFMFPLLAHLYVMFFKKPIFDKTVSKINLSKMAPANREILILTTPLVIFVVSHVIIVVRRWAQRSDLFLDTSMVYALYFLNSLITVQFIICLAAIVSDFKSLGNSINPNSLTSMVEKHDALMASAREINSYYGIQLCFRCIQISVLCVSYIYKTIIRENSSPLTDIPYEADYVLMVTLTVIEVMVITRMCERTSAQAEAFITELFTLMRDNEILCSETKLFLYVTSNQAINFTACGFFHLGYPLVTSIIAAAVTYLVVLVQFALEES